MKNDFEYMRYSDSDRLAMLETRAAEIERMLGSTAAEPAAPETAGVPEYPATSVVYPASASLEEPDEYPGAFEYPQGAEDDESEEDESEDEEPDGRTEVLI